MEHGVLQVFHLAQLHRLHSRLLNLCRLGRPHCGHPGTHRGSLCLPAHTPIALVRYPIPPSSTFTRLTEYLSTGSSSWASSTRAPDTPLSHSPLRSYSRTMEKIRRQGAGRTHQLRTKSCAMCCFFFLQNKFGFHMHIFYLHYSFLCLSADDKCSSDAFWQFASVSHGSTCR